jgi:hypothetical protein
VDRVPAAALALALTALALASAAPVSARPAPASARSAPASARSVPASARSVRAAAQSAPTAAGAGCSGTATASDVTCGPYADNGIVMSNGFNTYDSTGCWAHPRCGYHLAAPRRTAGSAAPWSVTATEPARNTGVRSYPDEQQLTNNWCGAGWGRCASPSDTPLARLRRLRAGFSETMPHNARTIAQAAWDIWFSNAKHNEVMVWVDNVHRGTGGARVDAHARFAGQAWTLENYGGEIIWSLNHSETSGTVRLLPMLRWLQHHTLPGEKAPVLPAKARVGQVNFGWEICSTGGRAEKFTVNRYWLHAAAR